MADGGVLLLVAVIRAVDGLVTVLAWVAAALLVLALLVGAAAWAVSR